MNAPDVLMLPPQVTPSQQPVGQAAAWPAQPGAQQAQAGSKDAFAHVLDQAAQADPASPTDTAQPALALANAALLTAVMAQPAQLSEEETSTTAQTDAGALPTLPMWAMQSVNNPSAVWQLDASATGVQAPAAQNAQAPGLPAGAATRPPALSLALQGGIASASADAASADALATTQQARVRQIVATLAAQAGGGTAVAAESFAAKDALAMLTPALTLAPQTGAAAQPQASALDAPLPAPSTPSHPAGASQSSLREALGERLQLALGQGRDQALIRLDPPMLGHIEIQIRHEGGQMQVHLRASHPEVAQQLQAMSDGLRQDLSNRLPGQATHVEAGLAQGQGQGGQQQGQPQRGPGLALGDADTPALEAPQRFQLIEERA